MITTAHQLKIVQSNARRFRAVLLNQSMRHLSPNERVELADILGELTHASKALAFPEPAGRA